MKPLNHSKMKQTAVEWLVQEISFLKDMNFDFGDGLPKDIINKAKEMEKEQMLSFYHEGSFAQMRYFNGKKYVKAIQYYNKTYKSE